MPSFTITGLSTSVELLGSGEQGLVTPDGLISRFGLYDAIVGSGLGSTLTILGDIVTSSGGNNAFDFDGASTRVIVGPEATVNSLYTAFDIKATGQVKFSNAGSIVSLQNTGVLIDAADDGLVTEVRNTGLIEGQGAALRVWGGDSVAEIVNTGRLVADFRGVNAFNFGGAGETYFVNSGDVVTLAGRAYEGGNGIDTVFNVGLMVGDVLLSLGDDIFEGDGGHVTGLIDGGDGLDVIRADDFDNTVLGGDGADIIAGRKGDDNLDGGAGADHVKGGAGADIIDGGAGKDTLRGNDGDDNLAGGGGMDILLGGRGDDTLGGGTGADRLNGGRGDDLLEGGSGADIFVFRWGGGHDRVQDFEDGVDLISFAGAGYNFADLTITQQGSNVLITTPDTTVLLSGMDAGDISAIDFLLDG